MNQEAGWWDVVVVALTAGVLLAIALVPVAIFGGVVVWAWKVLL